MSVVYRDRDRYDDNKSTVSARTSGGTKVTRYVVKEEDSRTDVGRQPRYDDRQSRYDDRQSTFRYDDRTYDRGDTRVEETRILRTSREEDEPQRTYSTAHRDPGYSKSRETITIRRDESPERRDRYWEKPAGEAVEDRELVIRRTVERDNAPRERDRDRDSMVLSRVDDRKESVAISRYDDKRESRYSDYELVSPQRDAFDDREREVQRYVRTTDYYQPPAQQQPQTIIIRQEPIIIRERERSRPREEEFQIVKKSDIDDERSVSRRSERREPRDEEYFYEKRVRERLPEDEKAERRLTRRPISPGDSVSQAGRRDRGYESDDSMVYVRKETREDYGSRDSSAHRKRELAAGAIAGIGAAELLRNHNRKEGKETSQGAGRLVKSAGAGLIGVVAAEGLRRYRSKSRRRGSRSRSDSRDRNRRGSSRHGRSRSRSRSSSNNRFKSVGGLGLAAAAVAAGALIASRNKKKAESPEGGRSRSRRRRSSRSRSRASSRASELSELENDPNAKDERNPKTRNQRTAAAGAVGAAAMALWEKQRSKSRGRAQSESPNRFKQGLPIAGAGLAAAGLAHLYEKRRAKEGAEAIVADENRRSRSRSRSKSRARTDSTYYDGPRPAAYSDPTLIQYGNEPLHGNNYGEGYYGRPPAEHDYYNNSTRDIVPAPVPPPAASSFDANVRRPRNASRTRSVSSSRSRSRSRGAAATGAAVGTGVAASEYENRRRDKKERKRRSRQQSRENSYAPYAEGRDPYEDANWHATHSASYARGMHDNDPYASQTGFYPSNSQFPPPPGSMPQQGYAPQQPPQPTYTPQSFPPPPAGAPQGQYMNHDPYAPNQNPYAPRPRGTDDNVSAASFPAPPDQHHSTTDGVSNARSLAMSPPIIGPNVTVQRPSTSTPSERQATIDFPGSTNNPFQPQPRRDDGQMTPGTGPSSSDASPGARPGERSPVRSSSRAAQAYTPPPPLPPLPNEQGESDRGTSAQLESQLRGIPVVTDRPTPQATPRPIPEHPAVTKFKQAAYGAPDLRPHDPRFEQVKQPEMMQTNRRNTPFMQSPDIRPPSDDTLTIPPQHRMFSSQNDNAPSMPPLFVPESPSSYVPPSEERRERDRSRSQSAPRTGTVREQTSRVTTPTQESKKSVSFAPKPEFSDAPGISHRPASDLEVDNPDASRRLGHDREGDSDRGRDEAHRRHSRERHGYDGGDDLSDDTPFEDHRRRSHDRDRDREKDYDRGTRHSSRRERSNTQSLDPDLASTRDQNRDGRRDSQRSTAVGSSSSRRDRDASPADSDATVDLPDRFDKRGRKKAGSHSGDKKAEEDDLAEKLDQILGLFGGGSSKKR